MPPDALLGFGKILFRECNLFDNFSYFSMVQVYLLRDWLRLKMGLVLVSIVESINHTIILRARVGQTLKALSVEKKCLSEIRPGMAGRCTTLPIAATTTTFFMRCLPNCTPLDTRPDVGGAPLCQ